MFGEHDFLANIKFNPWEIQLYVYIEDNSAFVVIKKSDLIYY